MIMKASKTSSRLRVISIGESSEVRILTQIVMARMSENSGIKDRTDDKRETDSISLLAEMKGRRTRMNGKTMMIMRRRKKKREESNNNDDTVVADKTTTDDSASHGISSSTDEQGEEEGEKAEERNCKLHT